MNFYFQPRTQAYKNWEQVKIGDRVLYKSIADGHATVRNIYTRGPGACAVIEFDKPVRDILTHDCWGEVPSGNGYFVFEHSLIGKIIE